MDNYLNTALFTDDAYGSTTWSLRDTELRDANTDQVIFRNTNLEFPTSWSDDAVRITAQKYFTPTETSLKQMVNRVVDFITKEGCKQGHLSAEEANQFEKKLKYLIINQYLSFNSPVWFNVGVPNTNGQWCCDTNVIRKVFPDEHKPQISACFIQSIEDDMRDILTHYVREGRIFANGSGSGTNYSSIRGSMEFLSGGGIASGPVSFMRGFDVSAGTIKSGGKTRRAAKMAILNIDHPDIEEFITCKAIQEHVARDLIKLGYNSQFDTPGGAYDIAAFQNTNHSVRVTDDFMRLVESNGAWCTRAITTGKTIKEYGAKDLLMQAAKAAWECGDPGIQFHTTINQWNTVAATKVINASNPCSEYMFVDDSACNLASLNLMRFLLPNGTFHVHAFCEAVHVLIIAMDILIQAGGYPTEEIACNSYLYRPLGLGYSNLGALLMSRGYAYDSPEARSLAAEITAIMTGQAYLTSAYLAKRLGAFPKYGENAKSVLDVIKQHRRAATERLLPSELGNTAKQMFNDAVELIEKHGVRNAQVTLLAPCGTISFMMDCNTTGIEPEMALVRHKTLVGGGTLKLTSTVIQDALCALGYPSDQMQTICTYIYQNGMAEGAPHLKEEHLAVFDTACPVGKSSRVIQPMGHVQMMAAVQPFLSGAISKTVNLPNSATVEDVFNIFVNAWEMGLKAISIYRDGSKGSQPISTSIEKMENTKSIKASDVQDCGQKKLIGDRNAIIHEFNLSGLKGFLTVGLYEDGTPGEIFVDIAKEGSTVSGLADAWAIMVSLGIQYGVPLEKIVKAFSATKFDPSGWSNIPEIGYAHSLPDYIVRWIDLKFLEPKRQKAMQEVSMQGLGPFPALATKAADGPLCTTCGSVTERSGTCHVCPNCGATTGCS